MKPLALISTRKGLFRLNHDKTIEPLAFLGVPVSMVLAGKDRVRWYAALDHGHFGVKLHRSDDYGDSWQEITAPAYPKTEDKAEGNTLNLVWSLAYADPDSSDKLWAGTVPGGLFYSDNGGESWQLNQFLWQKKLEQEWFGGGFDNAGIHSICVDPRDPNEVKIAVSCAGVWVTRDRGATWQVAAQGMRAAYMPPEQEFEQTIQDPHLMVQCAAEPDCLWVQHHNGVFKSIDNAHSWQEIENIDPSVFGFTVAVDPSDPNKAWFVPGVKDECRVPVDAKLVVTRTVDGGETFEQLNAGLPQGLCYDLVFRHAMDIDSFGEKLLMGSTTGNLWLSQDQGTNWDCVSNYLPPVYAVNFL